MTRTKTAPSPLAEDAAPLDLPEPEVIVGDEAPDRWGDGRPVISDPGYVPTVITPVMTVGERDAAVMHRVDVHLPPHHLLDIAPVNSKIVVTRYEGVVTATLATPDNTTALPKGDPASKLPEGAVIRKVAEGKFEAHQLSPAIEHPKLKTTTAGEAISGFVPHFHSD